MFGAAGLALALSGCSAGLIDMRGASKSAYAPVNEGDYSGGIVKLECGTTTILPILRSCEESGERMMHDFCGGAFHVAHKRGTLNGEVEYEEVKEGSIFGHAITESEPKESTNEYLYFDCVKENHAPENH
jgi:hypothetical protein